MKLRIGLLSTARINFNVIIRPSKQLGLFSVEGIASRSLERAEEYAKKYEIPNFYGSYEDLLNDPNIDVVYISLPNALHVEWIMKSLYAGKHVICEKPFAPSVRDGKAAYDLAVQKNLLLVDALHYHYHPVNKLFIERIRNGDLGKLISIKVQLGFPKPPPEDIRYQTKLLGGSFMHMGCYCGHFIHQFFDEELNIINLNFRKHALGADVATLGVLQLPKYPELEVLFKSSMEERFLNSRIEVQGEKGFATIHEPFNPIVYFSNQSFQEVWSVESNIPGWPASEKLNKSSYDYQLEEIHRCLENGVLTPHVDLRSSRFVEQGRKIIYGDV